MYIEYDKTPLYSSIKTICVAASLKTADSLQMQDCQKEPINKASSPEVRSTTTEAYCEHSIFNCCNCVNQWPGASLRVMVIRLAAKQ